jgi:hypothetical protein
VKDVVLSIKFTTNNSELIMATNKEVYYARLNKSSTMKISKVTGWKGEK